MECCVFHCRQRIAPLIRLNNDMDRVRSLGDCVDELCC